MAFVYLSVDFYAVLRDFCPVTASLKIRLDSDHANCNMYQVLEEQVQVQVQVQVQIGTEVQLR